MEKTLKELKQEAVDSGFSVDDVQNFKTKLGLATFVNAMKKVEKYKEEIVEKVDVDNFVEKPAVTATVERNWKSKADKMWDKWMKEPTITITIDLQGGETAGRVEWITDKAGRRRQKHLGGAIHPVTVNGARFMIPKGAYVEVPRSVGEIIKDSQKRNTQALNYMKIDRIDPNTGKTIEESM